MIFHRGQFIQKGFGFRGIQNGAGIGSFFSGLFRKIAPLASRGARAVGKALTSPTAKKIASEVKDAAIDTGLNLVTNALEGKDAGEGLQKDLKDMKNDVVTNIKRMKRRRKYDLLSEEESDEPASRPAAVPKKRKTRLVRKKKKQPKKRDHDFLSNSETENTD